MLNQIDLAALADYMIEEVDCSAEYEDDCFGIEFRGHRFYVERRHSHFHIENNAGAAFQLPRY